jgi:polyhydroxyalkanoate synthesis regulator phasin
MKNSNLSRQAWNAHRDIGSIIDDFILEIDDLESDKYRMQEEIYRLKERVAELEAEQEVGNG